MEIDTDQWQPGTWFKLERNQYVVETLIYERIDNRIRYITRGNYQYSTQVWAEVSSHKKTLEFVMNRIEGTTYTFMGEGCGAFEDRNS